MRAIRCGAVAASTFVMLLAGCQNREAQVPNRANFTAAVEDYLAKRGRLCLAKYDWPIVVSETDRQTRSTDAEQMVVLESLGLASGRDQPIARKDVAAIPVAVPARAYTLTSEGEKYYVHEPVVIADTTRHVTHPADFCVARLSLDRVFGWEKPQLLDGRMATSVLFSYRVEPVPWMKTPDARRAFPLVARAIENAGVLQLRLGVHAGPQGWVADELSS